MDIRSPWFPTDREETISSTEINNWKKAEWDFRLTLRDNTAPEDFLRRKLYLDDFPLNRSELISEKK